MARANVVTCSVGLDARAAPVEISIARNLAHAPSQEQPDETPFSFAFSGRHDGGALPLPLPPPPPPPPPPLPLPLPGEGGDVEEAAKGAERRAAHGHYGHVVAALLEAKKAVDAVISGAAAAGVEAEGAACEGVAEAGGIEVIIAPTKKARTSQ
jgi:hypothetical protein